MWHDPEGIPSPDEENEANKMPQLGEDEREEELEDDDEELPGDFEDEDEFAEDDDYTDDDDLEE